ncbi:hypothetical protein OSTOST_16830, partial [Ostertagia ostertagi]
MVMMVTILDEGVNTAVAQQTPVPTDQCRTASEPTSKPTIPLEATSEKETEKLSQAKFWKRRMTVRLLARLPRNRWDDVLAQAPPLNECASEPQH